MKHEINVLGIDIAKRVFHAVGMDNTGKIVYCNVSYPPILEKGD